MSEDPYRVPPARFFKDDDHGIFVALDQVVGVVKFSNPKSMTCAIEIFLKNGSKMEVHWSTSKTAAGVVYDRLTGAMEALPQ